jgi:hypothetical protein
MKKFLYILMSGIKIVLLVAIGICSWVILTPYFRTSRNTEGDLFRNIPNNTIDALAIGSSHIQYAFNPAIFYQETGYYSYVLGSSCQPLAMSSSMLEEALKTQHPSVVFVDVFTLLEQSEVCYADTAYYKAIDEMTGETRINAASKAPESVSLQYAFDLIMNHDSWKTFDLKNINSILNNAKQAEGYNSTLGYVSQEVENPRYAPLITYEVTETVELSDTDKKNIDDLINLCDSENIKLIFIKTPYIIDQESTNTLHAIWSYLDSKGAEYVDFIEKAEELNWYIDMDGDSWHNNSWGAEIITKYLSNLVNENNYVTRHTTNSTYESLLKDASSFTASSLMNRKNVDIYRLLEEASKYPCFVVMNYTGYNHTSLQEYESNALQNLGMTKDFLNNPSGNYYAVIKDGKLIQENTEPFNTTVDGVSISISEDSVTINDVTYNKTGEMQIIFGATNRSWTNDVNIDYASKWFWKNGCDGFTCE